MAVLAIAAVFFATTFLLQLVIWRIRLPQRQVRALLLLYVLIPIVLTAIAYATGYNPHLSAAEIARIWVLYLPVSLAYIALYAAIELSSPTLLIISHLAAAKDRGCTEAELLDYFKRKLEVRYRFELMDQSGLITTSGDLVEITPRGRTYGNIFDFASRVFVGIQKGG